MIRLCVRYKCVNGISATSLPIFELTIYNHRGCNCVLPLRLQPCATAITATAANTIRHRHCHYRRTTAATTTAHHKCLAAQQQDEMTSCGGGTPGCSGDVGPFFYVFAETPPLGTLISAGGVLALYLTLVYTLSRLTRTLLIGSKSDIIYTDISASAKLTEKVDLIYQVRTVANLRAAQVRDVLAKKEISATVAKGAKDQSGQAVQLLKEALWLEDEIYRDFIDTFRRPEMIYQQTGVRGECVCVCVCVCGRGYILVCVCVCVCV